MQAPILDRPGRMIYYISTRYIAWSADRASRGVAAYGEGPGRLAAVDPGGVSHFAGAGRCRTAWVRDHAGGGGAHWRDGPPGTGHALRLNQAAARGRANHRIRGAPRSGPGRRAAALLPADRFRPAGGRGRSAAPGPPCPPGTGQTPAPGCRPTERRGGMSLPGWWLRVSVRLYAGLLI